jgi:hypothetical protein
VLPFRKDLTREQAAQPNIFLGGNDEERAIQDLVRLHYVAYSRAQVLLLLLIVDEHLKSSPPAIGLGTDAEWFRQRVEVWPDKKRKGVQQHGLWD